MKRVESKGIGVGKHRIPDIVVQPVGMKAEDVAGIDGQRTVYKDLYLGQPPFVEQVIECVNDILRSANGKRRNDERAFVIYAGMTDDFQQAV